MSLQVLPYQRWAQRPASRIGEVIAGSVFGLLGALALVGLALTVYKALKEQSIAPSNFTPLAILTLGSIFFCLTAYRLLTGRGRSKDGSLFSPWVLRFIGLIFLGEAGLVAYYFPARMLSAPFVMVLLLGIGCFYLAKRQRPISELLPHASNDT